MPAQQILIVGGGLGGTMLANQLAARLFGELMDGRVRITVLSDLPDHYDKPSFMYVAFGACFHEDLVRSEDRRRAAQAHRRQRNRIPRRTSPPRITLPGTARTERA